MEDERNTQSHQGGETADQVEVKDRGLFDSLLGRKKEEEKKEDEVLVTGMEKVSLAEPEVKEDHDAGEKKESLLSKLHRSSSSSSSSSSSDEEEEVIDQNGEVVKRKKKKGLKEKIKEKLPGHKDPEGEYKTAAPAPAPASVVTHGGHHDTAVAVGKIEGDVKTEAPPAPEEEEKGLLDKIKEKLPGGHKKPEDAAAAPAAPAAPTPAPAPACNQVSDSEKLPNEEHSSDGDFLGNSDDDDDERTCPSHLNRTSNKVKVILKEGKSKKNVYVGWGSKELIGFLSSIGKDTSKSLDQFGSAEAVKEYIRQKGLLQKDKKKHVICDNKLWSLFRKSKLKYNKIYSLLERHIAANTTSEDETPASSDDNNDSIVKKKTRTMNSESSTPKGVSERYKRCFASLVRDNIKLIYLRRSLVMDLLKQPETFESKVTGSFVRVKNDPKDFSYHKPKKLYQLGQVTGIRKSSEVYKIRDISTDMLLCIPNMWSEVKISMLSDEDFEEEECEYLRLLAKKEPCKRHTVAELEEKARSVHGDIVSHWINKELQRLEKLIEMANEKGWRNEMHEYIDKRELLRTPSERQRLLEEVPQVIPDIEDSKDTEFVVAAADKSFQNNTAAFQGANGERAVCLGSCSEEKSKGANGERAVCLKSCSEEKSKGDRGVHSCKFPTERTLEATKVNAGGDTPGTCVEKQRTAATKAKAAGDTHGTHAQNKVTEATKADAAGDIPGMHVQKQGTEANAAGTSTQVINIDDDEDDSVHDKGKNIIGVDLDDNESGDLPMVQHETKYILCGGQKAVKVKGVISESTSMWYYMDPQGDEQGPFTVELLRRWNKAGWFDDDFRVWRAGQPSDSAILLSDALLLTT